MKNTLFYLIGDGYLGRSIKNILVKNGCTVIVQKKEDDLIMPETFRKYGMNPVVLYFAAPNKKEDLEKEDISSKYLNILNYLIGFENVIYANSEALFMLEKYNKYQMNYINLNKQIGLKSNFINLYIPYIYNKKMRKTSSLYYKIKHKNYSIPEKDKDKKIRILRKDLFILETYYKIRNIINSYKKYGYFLNNKIERYDFIELTLGEFERLVKNEII